MEDIGRLDLIALLASRLRLDLPGDMQLTMGAIHAPNPLIGKSVSDCYASLGGAELEIAGIVRGKQLILPRVSTLLRDDDQLLLISSPEARERLLAEIREATRRPGGRQPR